MESRFLKKAVVLSGMGCNSNCVFCLQHTREPAFFPGKEVARKIIKERERGANWLVLTGGEASIHPDFLELVRLARKLGYQRAQTVTNGRMFASRSFAKKAAEAGLTEVTLSFHGATPKKHDALTRVPGSFEEASRAARNCRALGLKLSFNTAFTSLNFGELRGIAKYIHEDLGFDEFDYDIIGTAPSGRTWKYKFLPGHDDSRESFRRLFEYTEEHGIVTWVTRTPIQDLPRGHQHHKEPWEVIIHDAVVLWPLIEDKGTCDPLKCEYCEAEPYCTRIKEMLSLAETGDLSYVTGPAESIDEDAPRLSRRFLLEELGDAGKVEDLGMEPFWRVTFDGLDFGWEDAVSRVDEARDAGVAHELKFCVNAESVKRLDDAAGLPVVFSPTNPSAYVKYSFEHGNILNDTSGAMVPLEEALKVKGDWCDVPLCIREGREFEYWANLQDILPKIEPRQFLERMINDARVHPWDCWDCELRLKCPGFLGDYVKLFGFDGVKPFSGGGRHR